MLTHKTLRLLVLAGTATIAVTAADLNPGELTDIAVQRGIATFAVNTNIPAVSVKGKSAALEAHVLVRSVPAGLQLERVEARLPVKSLATGMGVRDEHMQKYIFTTKDGQLPDLQFAGDPVTCTAGGADALCPVAGKLTVRGVERPFTISLRVHRDGASFKATGEGALKLSTFGIEQPSQFGVKTADDVQLHLEFTARPSGNASSAEVRR
jgi:polyisoprenoid-binding protein YceI